MSEPYSIHLPLWPAFDWTQEQRKALPVSFRNRYDEVDGDFPATRLSHWKQFHDVVDDERFTNDEFIFRGQQRYEWDLTPSLARGSETGTFTPVQAKQCMDRFRKASRGRKGLDPTLAEDLEMWALGQHHGLKTPLLDWTLSPYVALFFAFEHPDIEGLPQSDSRIVFALNRTRLEEKISELLDSGYRDDRVLRVFEPSGDSNRRLLNQAGVFVAVPPLETVAGWILTNLVVEESSEGELSEIIMKIHIPNEHREECLRSLRKMNIHHASLFPDLIGSSSYTNFEFDVYRGPVSGPGDDD